jgi:hypothetical protein
VKFLTVYAIAAVVAPVLGWLSASGVAFLLGRGDVWWGAGYMIVSGPPRGDGRSSALRQGGASALTAALTVLIAGATAAVFGLRPTWPLLVVVFAPTTLWRIFALRSMTAELRTTSGDWSLSDHLELFRLAWRHQAADIVGYVAGALVTGALLVH